MTTEIVVKLVAKIANRKQSQAFELYNLCDKDLLKYITLEALINEYCTWYVPANKEALNLFMDKYASFRNNIEDNPFITEDAKFYAKNNS